MVETPFIFGIRRTFGQESCAALQLRIFLVLCGQTVTPTRIHQLTKLSKQLVLSKIASYKLLKYHDSFMLTYDVQKYDSKSPFIRKNQLSQCLMHQQSEQSWPRCMFTRQPLPQPLEAEHFTRLTIQFTVQDN
jgi:hypothetical protein